MVELKKENGIDGLENQGKLESEEKDVQYFYKKLFSQLSFMFGLVFFGVLIYFMVFGIN